MSAKPLSNEPESQPATPTAKTRTAKSKSKPSTASDPFSPLRKQHKMLAGKAKKLATFNGDEATLDKFRDIARLWATHSMLDDQIVYPALRDAQIDEEKITIAELQRDLAALLLDHLTSIESDDPGFNAGAKVFLQMIPQLIALEERKSTGLFGLAVKSGADFGALQKKLSQVENVQAEDDFTLPPPRHLRDVGSTTKKEKRMRGNERERDERGRFRDDDDDRRGRRNSDYDDRRRSSSRSSRDDDDDGRGWHGDSRGHAEASRRGWDTRRGEYDDDDRRSSRSRDDDDRRSYRGRDDDDNGGGRGRSRYDDDDRRRTRSRDDDDDDRRGRRTGGWFGDSEGHSEASRRGWQNSDHGDSGWYGDSRGHSEASRRGWQNSDHGDSGWYGDPEGHSEASRRGWRNRRDDDDDRRSSRRR